MPKIRRPSHGTVVAYAALFVALGGTAAAAAPRLIIRPHSITSRDLAQGSVKTAALARSAVTAKTLSSSVRALLNQIDGSRIMDGTIPAGKLGPASVTAGNLAQDSVVNADLAADTVAGVRGWQLVEYTDPQDSTTLHGGTAVCPAGTQVLGGGIAPNEVSTNPALDSPEYVLQDAPELNTDGSSGWQGLMVWGSPPKSGWNVNVWAVCGSTHPRVGLRAP